VGNGVRRELGADLVAERIEPLAAGDGEAVVPGDQEAAVGQRHHIRIELACAVVGVDQKVGGDGVAVVADDRRANVGAFAGAVVCPGDDEAAAAQRGDVRVGFRCVCCGPGNTLEKVYLRSGSSEDAEGDVGVGDHTVGDELVLIDRHEVAVGQRREVGEIRLGG
jgi:hypothetical protein